MLRSPGFKSLVPYLLLFVAALLPLGGALQGPAVLGTADAGQGRKTGAQRRKVFEALDSHVSGDSADKALAALRKAGVRDSDDLLAVIRQGRPRDDKTTGRFVVEVKDANGRSGEVHVHVPASYRPDGTWGTLLLLHGHGGDGRQLLDAFTARAEANRLVIVAPSAKKEPEDPANEDSAGGLANLFLKHWWSYRGGFPLAALRGVSRSYRLDPERVFLCGYSMGGFGSWNIGLRFHDRFAGIAPLAGGLSRLEYQGQPDQRTRQLIENARGLEILFAHGGRDNVVPTRFSRDAKGLLEDRDIPFTYHEEPNRGHRLPIQPGSGELAAKIDTWLGAGPRSSSPETVEHVALGTYNGRAFWLRVEALDGSVSSSTRGPSSGPVGRVKAHIERKANRIVIEATGVAKLRLFLDPALINLKKAVEVVVNGRRVVRKKVKPSLDAVLDSWRDREDANLVYDHGLLVDLAGESRKRSSY